MVCAAKLYTIISMSVGTVSPRVMMFTLMVSVWVISPYIVMFFIIFKHKSDTIILMLDIIVTIIIVVYGGYKWISLLGTESDAQTPIAIGITSIQQLLFIIVIYTVITIAKYKK
jgi:hypothetical protein